jgi:hypothetical protein
MKLVYETVLAEVDDGELAADGLVQNIGALSKMAGSNIVWNDNAKDFAWTFFVDDEMHVKVVKVNKTAEFVKAWMKDVIGVILNETDESCLFATITIESGHRVDPGFSLNLKTQEDDPKEFRLVQYVGDDGADYEGMTVPIRKLAAIAAKSGNGGME